MLARKKLQVIGIEQKEYWDKLVMSIAGWDIYYLNAYAHSLQLHGDGIPYLFYMEDGSKKIACVMMKSDIAEFAPFQSHLQKKSFYDMSSVYGYGGPWYSETADEEFVRGFYEELKVYAQKEHIVTQFMRFQPVLENHVLCEKDMRLLTEKQTVYIDTESEERILSNMSRTARNEMRRARKEGAVVRFHKGEYIEEFLEIYNKTMQRNQASEYYYFDRRYYECLLQEMQDNIIFLDIIVEDKVAASSIFLYNKEYMHYHLSGMLPEYSAYYPTSLLLYEAAVWAAGQGIKKFHLGGGIGKEDSLFQFKRKFNKNGVKDYVIGASVFDEEKYQYLIELRKKIDASFDADRPFLIRYRA